MISAIDGKDGREESRGIGIGKGIGIGIGIGIDRGIGTKLLWSGRK
jgi:hypothetical protein